MHKQEEYMDKKKALKLKASQQSLGNGDQNDNDENIGIDKIGTPKHILEDVKDTIQVIQVIDFLFMIY